MAAAARITAGVALAFVVLRGCPDDPPAATPTPRPASTAPATSTPASTPTSKPTPTRSPSSSDEEFQQEVQRDWDGMFERLKEDGYACSPDTTSGPGAYECEQTGSGR